MRSEEGMSLVEVLVAALLLVVGALAVLGLVSASARNGFRLQQSQAVNGQLQRELEQITQLPYTQIGLTAPPAGSTDAHSPANRVAGTTFAIDRAGTSPRALDYTGGAVTGSGGTVAPGGTGDASAHFTNGNVSGTIYRYVVWDTHSSCPAPAAPCMKRVIVAIRLDSTASGGTRDYQELQAQVFDPTAKRSGTGSPGGDSTAPWTFWLTDTACNFASRQPIAVTGTTDGHATHNTRATCGAANSGSRTGSNAGPPDLMYTQAPPLDNSFPDDQQPLYDYSTDVEPNTPPTNTDKGVQLLNSASCTTLSNLIGEIPLIGNLLDSDKYLKVHKWLSPKVPSGFNNILFNGSATLNLWTRTVNDGVYGGGICAWLFVRELNILNLPVDTPVIGGPAHGGGITYFSYQQNPWPRGGWSEISLPMNFGLGISLPPNAQLGLAIAVDNSQTGGGLEFAYDAPSYDSRLQIQTSGSLPF